MTDGETVCREYAGRASSLYDSKMYIDYHNIPYISMHFQKDGMTPGCSVATSFLVGTH